MRSTIFSDIHRNVSAGEQVLANIRSLEADVLICLGGVVYHGPNPQEIYVGNRAVTDHFVLGNHDAPAPPFSPSPISPTTSSGTNRKKKIPSRQAVRMETRVVMSRPKALCAERGKAPLNCWEFAFGTIDIFPRDMKLEVF